MILGKLNQPTAHANLRHHPIWEEAFSWIERFAAIQAPGILELRQKQMYVNIHDYDTKSREACRYESHRVYIDLQYCISGGEIIEWCPVNALSANDEYSPEKDVTHYHLPTQAEAVLRMTAGSFAVFFPEDGHLPKMADGRNPHVEKLVIKIDRALFV